MTKYYIQDTRSYCGDSVVWWRPKRQGYTFRLDDAGEYSEREARRIENLRGTDKAIPVDAARAAASLHVVAGDLWKALNPEKKPGH